MVTKVMLKQYAESNSIAIYDYYVDDGFREQTLKDHHLRR